MSDSCVLVMGEGVLASAVADEFALRGSPVIGPTDVTDRGVVGLVVADDGWRTDQVRRARDRASELGVPWLRARTELGRLLIGPLETPGGRGCVNCAASRRRRMRPRYTEYRALRRATGEALEAPSPLLTPHAAAAAAAVIAEDLVKASAGGVARSHHALLFLDLRSLALSRHAFLPDPLCHVCGDLPSDVPEDAVVTLAPAPESTPGSGRVRDMVGELPELERLFLDDEVGIVGRRSTGRSGSLTTTVTIVGTVAGAEEMGGGRTTGYRSSLATAVLEGLERYGGVSRGRRGSVRASYAQVEDRAMDPRTLGLHDHERLGDPEFPYPPFDEDTRYRWVWGYSFARREPVLLPQSSVYYAHAEHVSHDRYLAFETSNGCALGGSFEEAALYGLLEVAERDAFLMTWYARVPRARVDREEVTDESLRLLWAAVEAETGYRVHFYDTTLEQGIPCVAVLAVNPDPGDGRPALCCSSGAHWTFDRAMRGALSELAPILHDLIERYQGREEEALAMLEDPELVRSMSDHSLLYSHPRAAERLAFLDIEGVTSPRRDLPSPGPDGNDLTDRLRQVVDRYLRTGMDVVLVDQTTPEHRKAGLSCVRAIVPGSLPMTFGHANRRVEGLPRLARVLAEGRPGGACDVNPDPHPFP